MEVFFVVLLLYRTLKMHNVNVSLNELKILMSRIYT
jgi:hypothetical protein